MASVNKVLIIGNLGRDPEVRYTPSGSAVCNVSVATTRRWKGRDSDEYQEETEWHRVVFYDKLAEIAGEYLRKGRSVYIEGRLKTRKWQDKEGRDNYTTEIIADQMQMLGPRDDDGGRDSSRNNHGSTRGEQRGNSYGEARGKRPSQGSERPQSGTGFDDMDDDIPF